MLCSENKDIHIFRLFLHKGSKSKPMNIEELRDYCMSVKGSTESLPFLKHNVLVFKVMEKMICLYSVGTEGWSVQGKLEMRSGKVSQAQRKVCGSWRN